MQLTLHSSDLYNACSSITKVIHCYSWDFTADRKCNTSFSFTYKHHCLPVSILRRHLSKHHWTYSQASHWFWLTGTSVPPNIQLSKYSNTLSIQTILNIVTQSIQIYRIFGSSYFVSNRAHSRLYQDSTMSMKFNTFYYAVTNKTQKSSMFCSRGGGIW